MKRATIKVTEEDINEGQRGSPSFCMISQAIRRIYPDAYRVRVWTGTKKAERTITIDSCRYTFSDKANNIANRWDKGKEVKPFSFVLQQIKI